ncbi:MAG: hypothetical protein ACYTHJ_01825 [Planctomycetota bacterium]|jgi:hypothetical protein
MAKSAEQQPEKKDPVTDNESGGPSPRAFVTGTGFVMQGFGGFLVMGSCVVWAVGNFWVSTSMLEVERWSDYLSPEHIVRLGTAIGLITSFVGALGLMAVGVGLQGEKVSSAWQACVLTAIMCVLFFATAFLQVWYGRYWIASIPHVLLGLMSLLLFLLSARSRQILRHFPPPADQSEVTDEWVEEYKQRKRANRGM